MSEHAPDPAESPDSSSFFERMESRATPPEEDQAAQLPADPFASPDASSTEDVVPDESLERLRQDARQSRERSESRRSFWRELPLLILVALIVAILIKTFLIQAFFIPSASMRDTLLEGDRVMVNKLAYRFGEPSRGDVIVFDSPLEEDGSGENIFSAVVRHVAESLGLSSPESALIKRVIAVGGETISIFEGQVHIDGVPIDEPYLRDGTQMPDYGPELIPEGFVFVMGDNRQASQDSRRFGPVAIDDIIGRAFIRVWPPSRWGGL